MDYETPDGSQFSLQEVFAPSNNNENGTTTPTFQYTSITALVNGAAFAGQSQDRMEDIDEFEVLNLLCPVPPENINPLIPDTFTRVPLDSVTHDAHYLKAPSIMYEDSLPGHTFVAECLLNEATVLEELRGHPHPNIAQYFGCIVKDGRITQICLKRYQCSLADYASQQLSEQQRREIFAGVEAAVKHLHSLDLAHNDVCPHNVCIDEEGRPVIIDFDSCLPFGEGLLKGVAAGAYGGLQVSSRENDLRGLEEFKDFLDGLDEDGDDVHQG